MVLSTNIDILFPDALMAFIARGDLDENTLYRTDRADITVPFGKEDAADLGAMRRLRPLRVNRRNGVYDADDHRVVPLYTSLTDLVTYRARLLSQRDLPRQVKPASPPGPPAGRARRLAGAAGKLWRLATVSKPHLNGCGDFTLMSRASWERVGGHAEWPMYSWNLDALLLYQARAHGIREVDLGPQFSVLHMDHSKGSGWSPEGAGDLFARMAARGVPVFTNDGLAGEVRSLGLTAFSRRRPHRYTGAEWGFGRRTLEDRRPTPSSE
jgi:hypothetical protein